MKMKSWGIAWVWSLASRWIWRSFAKIKPSDMRRRKHWTSFCKDRCVSVCVCVHADICLCKSVCLKQYRFSRLDSCWKKKIREDAFVCECFVNLQLCWFLMMWYDMVWCGGMCVVWCDMIWCSMMWCVCYSMMWYDMVCCHTNRLSSWKRKECKINRKYESWPSSWARGMFGISGSWARDIYA